MQRFRLTGWFLRYLRVHSLLSQCRRLIEKTKGACGNSGKKQSPTSGIFRAFGSGRVRKKVVSAGQLEFPFELRFVNKLGLNLPLSDCIVQTTKMTWYVPQSC